MKKGFTLVELLGVIIILALLTLLVFPNIINSVKNSSKKIDDATLDLIYNASDIYINIHISDFPKVNGNKFIINFSDLTSEDLLPTDLKLLDDIVTDEKCIQVMYQDGYKYELKNNGDCIKYVPYQLAILNGSDPNLYGNTLTPVIYNGNDWEVADINEQWYDYEKQEWANAVILNSNVRNTKKVGDTVSVDGNNPDALIMLVWIPRYEYKIEGQYGTHTDGTAGTMASPGEIKVNFISKETTTPSEGYIIHPAFTFGEKELSGIWVGKFDTNHESSHIDLKCSNENCSNADGIRILPNISQLKSNNVSNFFYVSRSVSRSGNPFGINSNLTNTHMMKNSEWGAVAYLTQSKYGKYGNNDYEGTNKKVYINNSRSNITGRSGGGPGASTPINETYTDQTSTGQYTTYGFYTYDGYLLNYDTNVKSSTRILNKGTGASTTGNIYGIYDMVGGAWDYVMGVFANSSGVLWSGYNDSNLNSGFTGLVGESGTPYTGISFPDPKYYDVYKASNGITMTASKACDGGICYGHAISEVSGWYMNFPALGSANYPWIVRGGAYSSVSSEGSSGIFYCKGEIGYASSMTFHLVFSEQ